MLSVLVGESGLALFASSLLFAHTITGAGLTPERVAVVVFGLNVTLAALMV